MKQTCNGCRALETGSHGNYRCDLGFKVVNKMVVSDYSVGAKPLEVCPKPKTNDAYLSLKKESSYGKDRCDCDG